ncbi:energy transducer TonB [Mariprofundus erugo]|uniref:Energy transducer TonB n=1 Tax=Mariprofundus erugo TaxID=2528639 RepID=A0A5R9GVE1_9PROT|nr:energy transducer TonB [Mariprofundus erugo]
MTSSIRLWPWVTASIVIHGLLLLVLPHINGSRPASAGGKNITVELVSQKKSAPAIQTANTPAPYTSSPVEKKPALIKQDQPSSASNHRLYAAARPVAPTAEKISPPQPVISPAATVTALSPAPVPAPVAASAAAITLLHEAKIQQPTEHQPELIKTRIRQHLESFKYYPASARRRGIEGQVDVGFTLSRNGTAEHITVLQGSGYAMLDQAALQTVLRAQPFPADDGTYRFRLRFQRL